MQEQSQKKRKSTDKAQDHGVYKHKHPRISSNRKEAIDTHAPIRRYLTEKILRKHRHKAYELYAAQRPKEPRWRPKMHVTKFLRTCSQATILEIQKFARGGGPDCSDIRGRSSPGYAMEHTQSITARALVSYGPYSKGGWKLKEKLALRPLWDNELLVEVVASGICQTDLHFAGMDDGFGVHYPRDPDTSDKSGAKSPLQKPTTPYYYHFHPAKSASAAAEDTQHTVTISTSSTSWPARIAKCSGMMDRDLPAQTASQTLWTVFRTIKLLELVDCCGIQTGAGAVINAAQAHPEDRVAVIGLGGVGLSAVMGARIAGCTQIIAIARNEARLKLALDLGATDVVRIDPAKGLGAVTEAVHEITAGLGANITLDTTGVPVLVAEAVRMTAFKGTILQLGTAPVTSTLEIPIHEFMVSGKRFQGVVEGDVNSQEFVPTMVDWVRSGLLPLQKMVGFYQAGDFEDAIRDMHSGKTIKPVLLW
ncbi:uncharacterized protein DSM5745_10844 [Aspergillus mulundensis]|uniref:Alcohol dehydrogenase-like C-terminal domain-containing protein n=1 Tax=Aspergillus mulundensis TaxID=1810919 RepID=A0A3D8QEV8_9EURO|nr:hypothetical protein DSM5745_10844 [Aspergillus mulundensis]RDW60386.1 hypothetical protein DSM5745_10844 [Aspergillus mulundensis]